MSSNRSQYYTNVWDQVLDNLRSRENIDFEVINTFFTNIQIYDLTDTKAILATDNIVTKRICSDSLDLIQAAFIEVLQLDEPIIVELYTQFELPDNDKDELKEVQINIKEFESMPIQPDRTFDNFVVGDCNRESQVASFACALKPGEFYNPLFIYGNSGLGKTHLLMAIGNYVKTNYPDKKVYYIESLKFVDKVVKAIQNNQIDQFKHRCLAARTQHCTECTRLPGSLAGVCSPTHPEADSLGAQQLPHTRSFPSALLPSRDVCSWLGPAPACLGSRPQPQLRASSP